MPEYLPLGPGPTDEACASLGITPDFARLNALELAVYEAALIAVHGPPPGGTRFVIRHNRHDFGDYAELTLRLDTLSPATIAYAKRVEPGLRTWIGAGFRAPVNYGEGPGHPRPQFAGAENAIISALVAARPNADGNFACAAFAETWRNLEPAYPASAAAARACCANFKTVCPKR